MLIRKALPEDAYEYTVCHINCWRDAYNGIIPDEVLANMSAELEQRTERARKSLSEPGDTEFYCVKHEDKMIGRLIVGKSTDEDKPGAGMLGAIYLLEEFWDMGYGTQMMKFALDALKRLGYSEITLWVLEENSRARKFYEKHGFTPDGTKKDIELGKPIPELRYSLMLNAER